jgi:general nucleoside transport system ATP-binding protein
MMGRTPSGAGSVRAAPPGRVVLSLREVSLEAGRGRRLLSRVSVEVRAGEILGLAGVAGNGQGPLFETIAGLRRPSGGEIRLDGARVDGLPTWRIARLGLGHVPDDRYRDGLAPDLPIAENLILGRHWDRGWRDGPLLATGRIAEHAAALMHAFDVVAAAPWAVVRQLSGGNAQKVILAREFAKATCCLLCNQPTRGLDLGVVERVRAELRRKRDAGIGILLASEELEDLLELADRIAVIFQGRILAVLPRAKADYAEIGRLMAGHDRTAGPPGAVVGA